MIYLIDACTAINFMHIDEDEFLIKKLESLNFQICKTVFDEINKNVFNKFKSLPIYPISEHKKIDVKLNYFRQRIHSDDSYFQLEEEIKELTNYVKINGEFHSLVLSFYLNTFEKARILFCTDDVPAKTEFMPYFLHNRMGLIEDSIDLLILLYRHNDDFTRNDLKRYLSNLFTEYVSVVGGIEKSIEAYEIPKNQIKNQELRSMRDEIRKSIKGRNVERLQQLFLQMAGNKNSFESLFSVLSKYEYFFQQNISREYLNKIKEQINFVDSLPFYKWAN